MKVHNLLTAGYAEVCRAKANHDHRLSASLISSLFMVLNLLIFLGAIAVICGSAALFGAKRFSWVALMIITPLLMAAMWMDKQPSLKPYQAPVLSSPVGSVPITGREAITRSTEVKNPLTPTEASLADGKALFAINCAMCHGQTSAERGPVGKKLAPPPPGLDHELVHGLDDAAIFKAVTFGFGRMPPFKDKLEPLERWKLVNYLRTRQ